MPRSVPGDPPTMSTFPRSPLCARRSKGRIRSATIPTVSRVRIGRTAEMASSGMPMSTTVHSPTCSRAGQKRKQTFGKAMVTVSRARTAGPAISPVSAESPEGMSTAMTLAGVRLIDSTISALRPVRLPLNPVPRIASTSRSSAPSRSMPFWSSGVIGSRGIPRAPQRAGPAAPRPPRSPPPDRSKGHAD